MICISPTESGRRVLTVIRWPLGGIRTYLLYNYPLLAEAGYTFTLVGPADESFRQLGREVESWEGVELVEAPVSDGKCGLRSTVRRLLGDRRYRLIHSHGITAGVQAILANAGLGVPHVITSHDVIRPNQFAGLAGWMKLRILSWLLSRAEALVAVSNDARVNHLSYLPCLRRRSDKVVTILNGIDTARFRHRRPAAGQELRKRVAIADDVCLMGFLGRFMEQKGFLVLARAMAMLLEEGAPRRIHLVALGSGDYLREYRDEIARWPDLSGRITFLDHTPDTASVLHALDLLVMPSLWEACPLLPMEAMCAGIPVLGSDCIGLREVLIGSPSVMVPAGDDRALAAALRQAVAAPWKDEARQYAPAACHRFDVRQQARSLESLFERFVR
jgi:glycosyltransferase involved in cell wall biosynthesis